MIKLNTSTSIIIGSIIISLGLFMGLANRPSSEAIADAPSIRKDDHVLGNPKAKTVIIEYSDTECPFCKKIHATMHELVKKNPDIAWVYRHLPIPQLHSKAVKEAEATECASDQGKFWEYIDKLFTETQSNNKLPDDRIYGIAKDIGLNTQTFKSCVDGRKHKAKIEDSMKEAKELGVTSTPYSFAVIKKGFWSEDTRVIKGAQPLQAIENIIK